MNDERDPQDVSHKPFTVVDRRHWAQPDDESDEPSSPSKPTLVGELEQKLSQQAEQLREIREQHHSAVQEFEKARARLSREMAQEVERHKRSILGELLDVLDNLDRALEAATPLDDPAAFHQGVVLIRDQFLGALATLGVRKGNSLGQNFDPNCHDAVSTVPTADPAQDGVIQGVVKESYWIGDDVLRPAMVAVGQKAARNPVGPGPTPEPTVPSPDGDQETGVE